MLIRERSPVDACRGGNRHIANSIISVKTHKWRYPLICQNLIGQREKKPLCAELRVAATL